MKIDKPGIYTGMTATEYFSDPCPAPSFTQSLAKILLEQSPLHAWHAHPRLNPDYRPDDDRKFDVGNIAHALLIGRGKDIVVLPEKYKDWRTDAAKQARDEAAAEGKLAVLGKHHTLARRMADAAREQINQRGHGRLFVEGDGEAVLAWQEDGLWLRQMVDWLTPDRLWFVDYKTTDMNVAPHVLGRRMADAGWHIQAAMAARGLREILRIHRICFLFVVQETSPPYCLNMVEIGDDAMAMGRKMLDHAIEIWRACIKANRFPGYPAEVIKPEFPGWAEQQWLDREIHEAARDRHRLDELDRRKDEGEPLSGHARAAHNLMAG